MDVVIFTNGIFFHSKIITVHGGGGDDNKNLCTSKSTREAYTDLHFFFLFIITTAILGAVQESGRFIKTVERTHHSRGAHNRLRALFSNCKTNASEKVEKKKN